ncbi:MAG: IPT/TIG domain-containing protein, partial [Candidatus Marinimicrobia bacterium]|nr:IPT/TIG domain-containing protein [Candidatus Neomarinimicrobiota bacterium]
MGNYVTIYGEGFGDISGQVYFNNVLAEAPACPASATWQNNQIIAVVPAGATDGPVKVVVPPPAGATAADYTDQTDDERGPTLPNFDVNDMSRPGICSVTPNSGEPRSAVVVAGTQFGTTQGTSEILFGGTRAERVSLWTATSIGAVVPLIEPATVPVQVTVGGQNSNPINFRVAATADAPRILSFSPTHGPVGEYVTIFGANFDDETGQVFFKDALGVDLLADVNFPAACGTDWWKNDQIIVKVPTGAATDVLKITTAGTAGGQSDDTSDLTTSEFTVDLGTAGPGICKITPDNGPIDLPVRIDGERFGASALVNFYRASPVSVTPTDGTQISTAVPTGAQTGPVNITSGAVTGNSVNFIVQDCRAGAVCPSGQQCCRDGSCAATCAAAAGRGYYFWQFSTGQLPIYPQVVESCSNPPPPPPSPSPWSGRDGGERVCINALIQARFTTKINSSSITSGENILVENCSDQTCATRSAVAGSITFLSISPEQDGFEFSPAGDLTRNTWYQVTLKSDATVGAGIRSCLGGSGCPDGGFFLDGDRDGAEGGDYVWRFKTRDSDETCAIGLVGVLPYEMTLNSVDATQDYNGLCYAANDVCITIDCSAYAWRWTSSDIIRAVVASSATPHTTATARAETEAGRPVRITGEIPSEIKSGSGNLTIDFTDPKVIEEWPNCSDACINAEIGAKFNTNMNRVSAENRDNVHLYIWKCGNGVLEPGEDCDDGNANRDDGCSETCLNEGSNARYGSYCGNDRRETGED